MKSAFLGLRTCIYRVGNMKAAKQWYSDVFEVQPYFDEPFYIGFDIGGYELGLQPEDTPHNQAENVLTYWGVNNVEQEYERLLQAGATAHEPPQNVGGEIVVASVRDPWGNVLGMIYNPDFKLK